MQTRKLRTKKGLEFNQVQILATREAAKHVKDPMVLAWLNRKTGRHSPDIECCQEEGKETWEIYAESRGGTLRIEADDQYVFIFREGLEV